MAIKRRISQAVTLLLLSLFSILMIVPLLWMLSTALKPEYKIFQFPPELLPSPALWGNFVDLFGFYPVAKYTMNTVYVTVLSIAGKLLSCTLVAYGFAKFRAPGKNVWFLILLSTMMIPWAVTMVPLFILYKTIGWYNTYLPLWVPAFFGDAFFVFLLRQFIMTIPKDLEESAKMDGAGILKTLWHVIVPILAPALAVVAMFTFINTWNDFLGPLLFLSDSDKATLQIAIQNFRSQFSTPWNYMMALATISVIPCLIIFFIGQKQIVEGITMTGVKG